MKTAVKAKPRRKSSVPRSAKRMSLREAVMAASRSPRPLPPRVHSHFLLEMRDKKGRLKWRSNWLPNLTTDTASGYTNRRDWQAKAMGGGLAPVVGMLGVATATSATTLTNTVSSPFPTAGQGLAGQIVCAGPNASGTGVTAYMVITSNSSTVLTGDQWYSAGTGAALGSTPNATCNYQILPGQYAAPYLALTADAGAPSSADTTLASELATNGFTRALATWAHSAAATTYTLTHTFTCTGGTTTINKMACFGAVNTTAGGVMPFESLVPSPPPMTNGDTLALTETITIN